jgi:membrane protein
MAQQTATLPTPISVHSFSDFKKAAALAFSNFSKHDVLTLSAALAFYTTLSLAPLLVIVLSIASLLGQDSQTQLINQIHALLGDQAASAIDAIIDSSKERPELRSGAGIASVVLLLFTAGGVFAQLQSSLNVIFETTAKASAGAWGWFRKRLLSMGMVITLGFLALVSLILSTVLSFILNQEGQLWQIVNFIVTIAVFSGLFAMILKYLPDIKITWKSALWGGFVTAILFSIGKTLIGLYLGKSAVGSAYGAAGSLVVLLTWVYYSGIILFLGAEITKLQVVPESTKPNDSQKVQNA